MINLTFLFRTACLAFITFVSEPIFAATVGSTSGSASVNNKGEAGYVIPIQLPPAPLGSEPSLALSYSQEGGNGLLGVGWSLQGLSEITRAAATLEQDGYTKGVSNLDSVTTIEGNGKYALNGLRLIKILSGNEYRTEVDTMTKVTATGFGFDVVTPSGLTQVYSPVTAYSNYPSSVGTLKWVITRSTDRGGNVTTYDYNTTGFSWGTSVALIDRITYPNGTITFDYEDRNDKARNYFVGAEIQNLKRLKKITVASASGYWYDYTFTYKYSDVTGDSVLTEIKDSRLNGAVSVTWPSADIASGNAFPATPSASVSSVPGGWTAASTAQSPHFIVDAPTGLDGGVRFLDLNADGFDDIIYSFQGTRKAYLNTRNSSGTATRWVETNAYAPPVDLYYEPPRLLFRLSVKRNVHIGGIDYGDSKAGPRLMGTSFSPSVSLNHSRSAQYGGVQLQDLNGDGYPDILYGRQGTRKAYLNNTNNAINSSSTKWIETPAYAPQHDLHIEWLLNTMVDNAVRLADLNGDGLVDYIYARENQTFVVRLNTGSGWSTTNSTAYHPKYPIAKNVSGDLVDNGIRFLDLNGDGLTDYLVGYNTPSQGDKLEAYLNNGSGFDTTSTAAYAPKHVLSLQYTTNKQEDGGVDFVDVNGDGLVDQLVGSKIGTRDLKKAYLNTGAGWTDDRPEYAPRHYLSYLHPSVGVSSNCDGGVRFEDLNGDGLVDYVFASGNDYQSGRAVYLNTGQGWANVSDPDYTPSFDFVNTFSRDGTDRGTRFVDFNGDGRVDIISSCRNNGPDFNTALVNQAPAPDLMTKVENEFGIKSEFTFRQLTEKDYYLFPTTANVYPVQNYISPKYVASRLSKSDGIGGTYSTDYTYAYARANVRGRGFLGFEIFESYDQVTGYATSETVSQIFPWIGMTKTVETKKASALVARTTNTLQSRALNFSKTFLPYYATAVVEDAKDATKITTARTFDDYGNLTDETVTYDGAGSAVTTNIYTNNASTWQIGLLTSHTVASSGDSSRVTYTYNPNGLLTSQTVGIAKPLTTTYSRGSGGVITGISTTGSGLSGRSESFSSFTTAGLPQNYSNALGHTSNFTYDSRFGLKTSETDPNGVNASRAYDELGRQTSQTTSDGSNSTTAYSADTTYGSKYKAVTTAVSAPDTTVYWDALNREVAKTAVGGSGQTRVSETQYFNTGLVKQTKALGAVNWATFTYDWLLRPLTAVQPSGINTAYSYSGTTTGLTATVNDSGHSKTVTKNSRDQVTRIDTGLSAYVTFTYDGNGFLTQTNASGAISTYVNDDRGLKTSMTDADMGAWSYQYDAAGNVTSQTDGAGNVMTIAYDALDRMTSRTVGGTTSTWAYDGTAAENKLGKLRLVQGPNSYRKAYHYDSLARPYREITQIDGRYTYLQTTYGSYSRIARVDRFWRPLGLEGADFVGSDKWHSFGLLYTYNSDGYATAISDNSGRNWWLSPSYDSLDKVSGYSYGNGIATTETHDTSTGELTRILSTVQDLTYSYDIFGNLSSRVDAMRGLTDTYGYDALNRLTNASGVITSYDTKGNITSKGGVTLTYGGTRPHAVTSAGSTNYTYDANGNLLSRGASTVSWTAFNQPLQMQTGGTTTSFAYGDSFNRVLETITTGTNVTKKYFLGSGFEQNINTGSVETRIYISAPSGTVGVRALLEKEAGVILPGGSRVATREELEYYHHDHLGSITMVTDTAGLPFQQYAFEAWGTRSVYGTPSGGQFALLTDRGYTGHEMLDEHALIHMNGRIYDPLLGRMLSPDTLIQDALNPQSHNRYSYAMNNPLNAIDPDGHFALTLAFMGYDMWERMTGRIDDAEFGKRMAVNGACLLIDLGSGGVGGEFAVVGMRATVIAARVAKAAKVVSEADKINAGGHILMMAGEKLGDAINNSDGPSQEAASWAKRRTFKWGDSGLKDHAARHSNLTPAEYLAKGQENLVYGKQMKGGGKFQNVLYYVRKIGDDAYSLTITDKSTQEILSIDTWQHGGTPMTREDLLKGFKNSGATPPAGFWESL